MPTATLLELTQDVLASLDSDEVNSITDTTEAEQVARIIRRCYWNIVGRTSLDEHMDLFQLTASGDNAKPVLMIRPSTVEKLYWIKYDKRIESGDAPLFDYVQYKTPTEFFHMQHMLNTDDSWVDTMTYTGDGDTHTIPYRNDKAPDFWTSVDDNNIFFDSFDLELESTLQKTKTMCYGLIDTTFTLSDSFVPDIDAQQFPLLLNDSISLAWAELKQAQHVKAEKEANKQRIAMHRNKTALPGREAYGTNLPNYGRK